MRRRPWARSGWGRYGWARPGWGRADGGAGSVLAVAVLGSTCALAAISLSLYLGLATKQAVAGAADAAALAAANTRAGLVDGSPCERAEQVASANGVVLIRCSIDGLVVTVATERRVLGIPVGAVATAGPPG